MSDSLIQATAQAIHDHACDGQGGCTWLGEYGADQACDLEQTTGLAEAAIAVVRESIAAEIEATASRYVGGDRFPEIAARIARGKA